MSVLSDSTIKAMIKDNLLVSGGDQSRVGACSRIPFLTGRIFTAGEGEKVIDWERPVQPDEIERSHFAELGHLVWIRPKGGVCLP